MDKIIANILPVLFSIAFIISLFWGIDCIVNNKKKQKIVAVIASSLFFFLTCFYFSLIAAT